MTTSESDNEIRITRIYDAPVALVWEVWTDPAHATHWWGPRGFSLTTHGKDLRPGGYWDYTMHGPDGKDWPNYTRYHEVVPLQKLVYDHGAASADAAPMFSVVATFRDLGGNRTEFVMRMILPTAEAARQTRGFVKAAGGNGTWDRLAEYLVEQQTAAPVFVINRSFDAPRAQVFDSWTTPALLATWLPPAGFGMTYSRDDIRPGGDVRFVLSQGDVAMHVQHVYEEVVRPDRLVYLQRFTDGAGNVARQPGAPTWPETTRVTVLFVDEGEAQTRVTVQFDVVGDATAEERSTFTGERSGMTVGWTASFDVLEGMLASA